MLTIREAAATGGQIRFEAREGDRLLAWATFAVADQTVRVTGAGGDDADARAGALRAGLFAFWGRGLTRYEHIAGPWLEGPAPAGELAELFARPCAAPRG